LTSEQVLQIHQEQTRTDLPFGELALRMGFLSPKRLKKLLSFQESSFIYLGEALLAKGYITEEQYSTYLRRYRELDESENMLRYLWRGDKPYRILACLVEALCTISGRFSNARLKLELVSEEMIEMEYGRSHAMRIRTTEGSSINCCLLLNGTLTDDLQEHIASIAAFSGFCYSNDMNESNLIPNIFEHYFCSALTRMGVFPDEFVILDNSAFEDEISTTECISATLRSPRDLVGILLSYRDGAHGAK
ncbi:MAG: hypothetical protein ACOC0K_02165, partial [bacterium]